MQSTRGRSQVVNCYLRLVQISTLHSESVIVYIGVMMPVILALESYREREIRIRVLIRRTR